MRQKERVLLAIYRQMNNNVDGFAANLIMTSTVNEPARRAAAAGTGQAAAHLRKRSGFESSPCLSGACLGKITF
jgi:hypothetical protein